MRLLLTASAALLLLLVGVLLPPQASARKPTYTLTLPSAGHVSVAAIRINAKRNSRGRLPTKLRLRFPGASSLPPSIRILFGKRAVKRKRSIKHRLFVVAVNKSGTAAAAVARREASSAGDDQTLADAILLYLAGAQRSTECTTCGDEVKPNSLCGRCQFHASEAANADQAQPAQLAPLQDQLKQDFGTHDPNLDTGHYDDGHAFGWNVKTPAQQKSTIDQIIDDFIAGRPTSVIPDLERSGGVDLDANGLIGPPPGSGGVDTIVGPPTIIGP